MSTLFSFGVFSWSVLITAKGDLSLGNSDSQLIGTGSDSMNTAILAWMLRGGIGIGGVIGLALLIAGIVLFARQSAPDICLYKSGAFFVFTGSTKSAQADQIVLCTPLDCALSNFGLPN